MSDRFIPFCIIEDILKYLPGRSVARFKCVCKSWQTFLTSPCFAAINFRNSMENSNPNLKVIFSTQDGKFSYFDYEEGKVLPMFLPSKIRYEYTGRCLKILGSCNGFLCISPERTDEVYVWNPYTYEYKIMAAPGGEICGFGYNARCRDYQVLTARISESGTQVSVFSLRNNSCKRLGKIPYVLAKDGTERGILVNGALHWMAFRDGGRDVVLLAYDINTEKFREVPMPNGKKEFIDTMTRRFGTSIRVGVLQDYLSVSFFERWPVRTEIWVMANYGEKESWTMYNINHGPRQIVETNVVPLCLMSKGKEILLVQERWKAVDFYFYDRDNQCFRNFKKSGMLTKSFDAITCIETNISLSP
ncbi:hypothetical protein ACHQM5_005001 [Ranunculus cassubicifolius]